MQLVRDEDFIRVTQTDLDAGDVGVFPDVDAARQGAVEVMAQRARELDERFAALREMLSALFHQTLEEYPARGCRRWLDDLYDRLAYLAMDLDEFVDACGPDPVSEDDAQAQRRTEARARQARCEAEQ